MSWHTNELAPGNLLIQDGDRVVGSIVKVADEWRVDILHGGVAGDLKFTSKDYVPCLAFIQGVQACLHAMLVPQQEGYPCSPHCAGYLRELEQRKEIDSVRAALKPFAEIGEPYVPLCGPTKAWPPDASARHMKLDGLQVRHFVAATKALNQQRIEVMDKTK